MKRTDISRRAFLRLSAGMAVTTAIASCAPQGGSENGTAETAGPVVEIGTIDVPANVAELSNAATGIPYVVKDSINNGEPITLEYWEWALDRYEYELEWAEEYMELYPNVTINVSNQSFSEYWTKLTVNVPAGQGPSLWHMHTSRLTEFCDGQLMDPIPDHVANSAFLDENWVAFSEGAMDCPTGTPGSRHFLPMGTMMPVMYINTRLWEEAGFSVDEPPASWDDLRTVAKALTKVDNQGRIVQAGFQADWSIFHRNGCYQQGRYLFTQDGKHAQVNNPESRAVLQFIKDLHEVDKVVDPELPDRLDSFASETTAIIVDFSWVTSVLRRNNPDLEWFAAPIPTSNGTYQPSYGNIRFAVEAVVNPYADDAEKAVAWDFWHFLYSDDNRVAQTIALRNGFIPPYKKLVDLPSVQSDQVANVIGGAVEWGIVNDTPSVYNTGILEALINPILIGGTTIDDAMDQGEQFINKELEQREDWNIIERNYKHDNLMIPDQP